MPFFIVVDDSDAQRRLSQLQSGLSDLNPLWELLLTRAVLEEVRESFASEGRGAWVSRIDTEPHPLLRDTNRLFRSVTERGASGQIDERSEQQWTFGTDVVYASTHEYGRGGIPARPFLTPLAESSAFDQLVEQIADEYVTGLIR